MTFLSRSYYFDRIHLLFVTHSVAITPFTFSQVPTVRRRRLRSDHSCWEGVVGYHRHIVHHVYVARLNFERQWWFVLSHHGHGSTVSVFQGERTCAHFR